MESRKTPRTAPRRSRSALSNGGGLGACRSGCGRFGAEQDANRPTKILGPHGVAARRRMDQVGEHGPRQVALVVQEWWADKAEAKAVDGTQDESVDLVHLFAQGV